MLASEKLLQISFQHLLNSYYNHKTWQVLSSVLSNSAISYASRILKHFCIEKKYQTEKLGAHARKKSIYVQNSFWFNLALLSSY